MQPHRAVHRGDQRHLDVEDVHQDFFALAIDLVVAPRGEEIEAVGSDRLHERIAAAGQDDDAIIRIGTDRVKQVDELLVGVAVEDERAAIGVKRHFKHARRRTAETGIGETVAIGVKPGHRTSSCWLGGTPNRKNVLCSLGLRGGRPFAGHDGYCRNG